MSNIQKTTVVELFEDGWIEIDDASHLEMFIHKSIDFIFVEHKMGNECRQMNVVLDVAYGWFLFHTIDETFKLPKNVANATSNTIKVRVV